MAAEQLGDPFERDEVGAIHAALESLEPEVKEKLLATLACSAALADATFQLQEGDTLVGQRQKTLIDRREVDKGSTKERFKSLLLSRSANRIGLDEPESSDAHSKIRRGLVSLSFLVNDLEAHEVLRR